MSSNYANEFTQHPERKLPGGRAAQQLRQRWSTIPFPETFETSPFGLTPSGRKDFRGVDLSDRRRLPKGLFEECDFSYGDLSRVLVESGVFQRCRFDYTRCQNFDDRGCRFTDCSFIRTDLSYAALGFKWPTGLPDELPSHFTRCVFDNAKLTQVSIREPKFIECQFVFKHLKHVDFGCSGFYDCVFQGSFTDIIFRGEYMTAGELDVIRAPPGVGLFGADFSRTRLKWIDWKFGFPVERFVPPSDGSAFVTTVSSLERALQSDWLKPEELHLLRKHRSILNTAHVDSPCLISIDDLLTWTEFPPETVESLFSAIKARCSIRT